MLRILIAATLLFAAGGVCAEAADSARGERRIDDREALGPSRDSGGPDAGPVREEPGVRVGSSEAAAPVLVETVRAGVREFSLLPADGKAGASRPLVVMAFRERP
jgi:hypothetical protein